MRTVSAAAARTHLSSLLGCAERGEEVVITRRGKAVARRVPAATIDRERVRAAIAELKELRDEGRR